MSMQGQQLFKTRWGARAAMQCWGLPKALAFLGKAKRLVHRP